MRLNWQSRGARSPSTLSQRPSSLLLSLALLAGLLVSPLVLAATVVERVRIHEAPDHTRVVLDVSAPVTYDVLTLTGPDRIVVDLARATLGGRFNRSAVAGHERIKALRTSARGDGQRLVLDVTGPLQPKAFALTPVAPYGHRLVIDLFGSVDSQPTALTRTPPPSRPQTRRDVLIMVDAGHGGEDPGALGPNGALEKTVVLGIAEELKERLDARPGFRAELVRTGDYYISLQDRTVRARSARADLFVSVHADAFKSAKVRGASVYVLSGKGASSEAARWLAEKENRSDLIGGVGDVTLAGKDNTLKEVLIDMSTHANRSLSIDVGGAVLNELGAMTRLHKNHVEQANFLVLRAPDIPSILVETGFISNPQEARQLVNPGYQRRLASAIDRAVAGYFAEAPPPGTLLAARTGTTGRQHVIRSGETLSGLAARYGIAARRIKEANGLVSDAIRIGQTLIIPAG